MGDQGRSGRRTFPQTASLVSGVGAPRVAPDPARSPAPPWPGCRSGRGPAPSTTATVSVLWATESQCGDGRWGRGTAGPPPARAAPRPPRPPAWTQPFGVNVDPPSSWAGFVCGRRGVTSRRGGCVCTRGRSPRERWHGARRPSDRAPRSPGCPVQRITEGGRTRERERSKPASRAGRTGLVGRLRLHLGPRQPDWQPGAATGCAIGPWSSPVLPATATYFLAAWNCRVDAESRFPCSCLSNPLPSGTPDRGTLVGAFAGGPPPVAGTTLVGAFFVMSTAFPALAT